MDRRVQKVITLMKNHLRRGVSSSQLAQSVNLSPSRLYQIFKDETGMPPAKYLRMLRMQQAEQLLETTFLSVKEIMARVGVTDESHFVRDFKRYHGLTPAQYRERFLENKLSQNGNPRQEDHLTATPALVRSLSTRSRYSSSPAPSSSTTPPPPILSRRPSYPRHLVAGKSSPRRKRILKEALGLLLLRQATFAELTTAITARIGLAMLKGRSISYRARPSTVPRRLPPTAEPPRTLPLQPSTVSKPIADPHLLAGRKRRLHRREV